MGIAKGIGDFHPLGFAVPRLLSFYALHVSYFCTYRVNEYLVYDFFVNAPSLPPPPGVGGPTYSFELRV